MSDLKRYSIGTVSKLLGISVQTIRYYQSENLITPAYVDEKTNYRYYDDKNIDDLLNIKNLRASGFSIKEIKSIGLKKIDDKIEIFNKKIFKLEEQMKKEKALLEFLSTKKKAIELTGKLSKRSEIKRIKKTVRYGKFVKSYDNNSLFKHISNIMFIEKEVGIEQCNLFCPTRVLTRENNDYKLCGLMAIYRNKGMTGYNYEVKEGEYLSLLVKGWGNTKLAYDEITQYANEHKLVLSEEAIELLLVDDDYIVGEDNGLREIQIRINA